MHKRGKVRAKEKTARREKEKGRRRICPQCSVTTVKNGDIGKKLKRDDGIHVTEAGRSRLASHIKDSIVDVLNLQQTPGFVHLLW